MNIMKLLKGVLIIICLSSLCYGQNSPSKPKGMYVDSANMYYQRADLPLYVFISHKPDGAFYQLKPEKRDTISTTDAIFPNTHGKHLLRHFNKEQDVYDEFDFYVDGKPPVSQKIPTETPIFIKDKHTFFGKNLEFSLYADDDLAGVLGLYYALDYDTIKAYQQPIEINQEGSHFLEYYAMDMVGNVENIHQEYFIVDLSPPISHHEIEGLHKDDIMASETRLYLRSTDSLSGISQIHYRLDDGDWQTYADKPISISLLEGGNHTLSYFSIDQVDNEESTKEFNFFLDKSAPIVSPSVLGDRYMVGNKIYFSGRSKLKLIALDNKSGVKEVKYAINGGNFITYYEPFYLPDKLGIHTIQYYGIDSVGNWGIGGKWNRKIGEKSHQVNRFFVDLNGPKLAHEYMGPGVLKADTMYIHPKTEIKLTGEDEESGLNRITYSMDHTPDEILVEAPLSVTSAGYHEITYFGYDNVNNRNLASFSFVVDDLGPEIIETFSIDPKGQEDELMVFPAYSTLYFAAVDRGTGAKDIFYSINGSSLHEYTRPIQVFERNEVYNVKVIAYDLLGNKSEKVVRFRTGDF